MNKTLLQLALGSCALVLSPSAAMADDLSDLKAELAAQRALVTAQQSRLEALEKKLEAAVANKAAVTPATASVTSGSSSASGWPAGLTLYGTADAGVEYGNYGKGYKGRVQSGIAQVSHIGLKGEKNLGDDLTAFFGLEAGISLDNGQNTIHPTTISAAGPGAPASASNNTTGLTIFSRGSFVGLRGKHGDLRFGRDYASAYLLTAPTDPMGVGGATAFRLWGALSVTRFDNGIYYATPSLNGWQGHFSYSAGMENNSTADVGVSGGRSAAGSGANNQSGPKDEGWGSSGNLIYKAGKLFLGAGYISYFKQGEVAAPALEPSHRLSKNLAASYDLDWVKLYGHYISGADTQAGAAVSPSMKADVWWLGFTVPFSNVHLLRAVYGRFDDKLAANRDSTHIGLGYEYRLDSQAKLYAHYATVSNQNGGTNSLCIGGSCQGYSVAPNIAPRSLMFGTQYRF